MTNQLEKLKTMLSQITTNDVIYEYKNMANIDADSIAYDKAFIWIDEFRQGRIFIDRNRRVKSMRTNIYFCRFVQMDNPAVEREAIRMQIESEIVFPFIKAFDKEYTETEYGIFYPMTMFDANEVSVMLEFDFKLEIC